MNINESIIRGLSDELVRVGRISHDLGLLGADGNLSIRVNEKMFIITSSGGCKGRIEHSDWVVIDLKGNIVKGGPDGNKKPSADTSNHLSIYQQRPKVGGIIHAHPIYSTVLSICGYKFPEDICTNVPQTMRPVAITKKIYVPASDEEEKIVRELVMSHDAIILSHHGAITMGPSLEEALNLLERLENVAKLYWLSLMLGNPKRIPPEMVIELKKSSNKFIPDF